MADSSDIKLTSDKLLEVLLKAKKIVVICGAGISAAADIPCFRGKDGLYSSSKHFPDLPQVNAIELFSISILKDVAKRSLHCRLIAELAKKSILAEPTAFHHFLRALDNRGTLLRVYTQNVDSLELKAGLHTTIPLKFSKKQNPPVRCIPLHGTLDELRCPSCNSIFKLEAYYPSLKDGQFPECSQCRESIEKRIKEGKRSILVPQMRPNVILYGETHPHGDEIAIVQMSDISEIDLLLVVGTSLMVEGTTKMIRQFSKALRTKFPTRSLNSPRAIYLNYNLKSRSSWKDVFDGWVETDCEEFANMGLNRLGEEWLGKSPDSLEAKGFLYADRRLDSKPSWRM